MTPLALLAPDQRAVLELVLRQGRSYGELSELLGIPEREVRDRAESALRALAGDPDDASVDTGRIADWLLGQQPVGDATGATADSVRASEPARSWAARAAERLREVGGGHVPEVPADDAPTVAPATATATAPATGDGDGVRSSRVGGAVLLGVAAILIAAFLVWFLGRDDDGGPAKPAAGAASTPAPGATPAGTGGLQATGNDILLTAAGGGKAEGLMRLFKAEGGGVQFAIGAQGVPNNREDESYAVWFTRAGGSPRLLGFPQTQVTEGVLTVGGPGKGDEKAFPRWFATYDKVLITRETEAKPARPGPAVLQGTLPHGKAAGG
jgi:hypothetical protein